MTLVGASRDSVGDAIRGVLPWVDRCLLVDTGAGDGSIDIAAQAAGDKAIIVQFPWCDDFSAARNFALNRATVTGATWAVTVDTDERFVVDDGADPRAHLARTDAGCVMVRDESGTYMKERFFRLPCAVRFSGPTHEAFPAHAVGVDTMPGMRFHELPKNPEQLQAKRSRDARILRAHLASQPDDPRWWYYLGDTLQGLGEYTDAIDAYDRCQALDGWAEEAAWACYRAAQCAMELDDLRGAITWCATGLARHPGLPELPWLAGVCSYRLGRHADAILWARHAERLGVPAGMAATVPRIGFRHPPASYEGPYDILRFSLAEVGDAEGARQAEADYQQALVMRTVGA